MPKNDKMFVHCTGSLQHTASYEHTEPVSQCNTQAPGTHGVGKRDHQRLQQAMENEERDLETLSHTELAYKRQLAADFVVQLAVKRGVKLRSGSAGRLQGGRKGGSSPPPGGGGWKAAIVRSFPTQRTFHASKPGSLSLILLI